MEWTTPVAPSALPLEGAPPADRQSRSRGGRLVAPVRCIESAASAPWITEMKLPRTSVCGPEPTFGVRFRARRSARQRRVRAGRSASLRRPALRAGCHAMLGLVARRRTHCVRFALCVQTTAPSQRTKRAARAATSPALLGASEARCNLPGRASAATAMVFDDPHATTGGLRGRRYPAGAISVATSSAGPGSARAQRALRPLTRRSCLSAESAANAASSAARPRTEQRSAVGAQRRPPQHEPPAGAACRDARPLRESGLPRESSLPRTAATGRKLKSTHRYVSCVAGAHGAVESLR